MSDSDALPQSDAELSTSCSQSASETFVDDIGSPVVHDPQDLLHVCIPRSAISRTYSSSDGGDDYDIDDNDNDAVGLQAIQPFSSLNACATSLGAANDTELHLNDEQGTRADDLLSLEELQLKADAVTEAIESTIPADTTSRPRRPRTSSSSTHHPRLQAHGTSAQGDIVHQFKHMDADVDTDADSDDMDHVTHNTRRRPRNGARNSHRSYRARTTSSCPRTRELKNRVDILTREIASLQVVTASRAADADDMKASTNDKTSDSLLRGEVCRLRITLDHVARLILEKAFSVRDELEKHR